MKCGNCGFETEGKFCTECGAKLDADLNAPLHSSLQGSKAVKIKKERKVKKPFYKRLWFILLVLVAVIVGVLTIANMGEKIVWNDMILGDHLPTPPDGRGKIHSNDKDDLWIEINKVSDKEYYDYVDACKKAGFTVEEKINSYSFTAYNQEGYKLSLSHYDDNSELSIDLEEPMKLDVIKWPSSVAGKKLPKPKSMTGKFSYENEDGFMVYIGGMSKTEYNDYIEACQAKGFNVEYSKGEDYYYADDAKGWHVSLHYVGNNVVSIDIDAPADSEELTTSTTTQAVTTTDSTEKSEDEPYNNSNGSGSIGSDFKKAMDSYEAFMNEYVDFMKEFNDNPNDLKLVALYADYISKYADFVEDYEDWEDEDLNNAELAYYIDVQARVTKKLLELS